MHFSTSSLGAAMNVGKDIMRTMSNTLIFAFAGGSLSELILSNSYNLPYLQLINSYNIGIEIIQGVAGSIVIILTMPLVSLFASILTKYQKPANSPSSNNEKAISLAVEN